MQPGAPHLPSDMRDAPAPESGHTRRSALIFLLITVMIDSIGIGVIVPVLPTLVSELGHTDLAGAAVYGGWLTAVFAIAQFFAMPLLGNLSDRFGRRPVLLASLLSFGVDYLVTGLAPTIGWLFATRVLAGIFGATQSTASAYIADVSDVKNRARYFGYVGAAFGVGFIFGPMLGGILGAYGARVPFFVAAALALGNVVYGYFVLPESLKLTSRRRFSLKRANPFGAFIQMRRYTFLLGLLAALLFVNLAIMTLPATWPFFTMLKFKWSESQVGYSLAAFGFLSIVVQGGLLSLVSRRVGDKWTAYIGLAFGVVGFVGFAFADQAWLLLAFIIPTSLGFLAGPSLVSIMSNEVPADSQGELQGAIASLFSLASVLAPIVMTQLFSYFSGPSAPFHFPGAPYLAAAVLSVLGLIGIVRVLETAARKPTAAAGDA